MAGATEQEQQKTNQLLEKVEQRTTESTGKLDALIEAVKQPSEYEKAAEDIAEETKDLHKTAEKHDKEIKKVTKQFHDNFDKHVQQIGDDNKLNQVHNQFIKDQEKKKEGMMKAADARSKREAKLATRMGKGAWDWTKGKVQGVTKAVGGFFENLMKLMALMGLWFALSWLKGKDLKKMWDNFRKQLDIIMDEWIPQWVKDLSFGEAMGVAIGALVGGWLVLKGALASAGWTIRRMGAAITDNAGPKSRLNKQIMNMRGKLADLVSRRNAIKMAMKMTDDLDIKSKLGQELKNTNTKITELEDQIKKKTTAMENAKKMADSLKDESKLSKDLKKTNKALAKAAGKVNVATEAAKLARNMSVDSKVGKDLIKANEAFVKLQNQQKMEARKLRTTQYNIARGKAGLSMLPEGAWIDEGGRARAPGDTGGFLKGFGKMGDIDPTTKVDPKKAGSFWDRAKAWGSGKVQAGQERLGQGMQWLGGKVQAFGQTKIGSGIMKGISAVKGVGALGTYVTAILEPLRGAWAGWSSSRAKGENVFEALMAGTGGAMHGFLDIIPMFVEFAELLAGAGINVTGWMAKALGADEKNVDEFIQDTFDAYHKYTGLGTGKGLSGAMFAANEAVFGKFDKKTTLQGSHQESGRTIGDWVNPFGDRFGEAWGSFFDLRYEEDKGSMVSDMQDPKKQKANREKWKKRFAAGDEWLEENVPGVAWINQSQESIQVWKGEMKSLLIEMMNAQAEGHRRMNDSQKGLFIDNSSKSTIAQYVQAEKTTTTELKSK